MKERFVFNPKMTEATQGGIKDLEYSREQREEKSRTIKTEYLLPPPHTPPNPPPQKNWGVVWLVLEVCGCSGVVECWDRGWGVGVSKLLWVGGVFVVVFFLYGFWVLFFFLLVWRFLYMMFGLGFHFFFFVLWVCLIFGLFLRFFLFIVPPPPPQNPPRGGGGVPGVWGSFVVGVVG